ncbi:hypothetical protein [Leifsonia xyli]|uniref:hypothetical protein n=1 Tax=Leifsonia xyli TaxID=1575 RepID=UPI001CB7EAD1|nr:hypothetical protein [Leifsonia xyli]
MATVPTRRKPAPRAVVQRSALYAALIVLALVVILPLAWIVLTSFKTDGDAIRNPYAVIPAPLLGGCLHHPRQWPAADLPLVPEQFGRPRCNPPSS